MAYNSRAEFNYRIRNGSDVLWLAENVILNETLEAFAQGEPLTVWAFDAPASTSQQIFTLEFMGAGQTVTAGTNFVVEEL